MVAARDGHGAAKKSGVSVRRNGEGALGRGERARGLIMGGGARTPL
jgi:hypothetical protein